MTTVTVFFDTTDRDNLGYVGQLDVHGRPGVAAFPAVSLTPARRCADGSKPPAAVVRELRRELRLGRVAITWTRLDEASGGWTGTLAAALGLPPRPRGAPRRADAPRPTVTITVDLHVLGVLAEVAAAAGVSPAQVAAAIILDWLQGQPDAWKGFAAGVAVLVASPNAADYARQLTTGDLPLLLDIVRARLAAGGAP
jgi:hypothetical protein